MNHDQGQCAGPIRLPMAVTQNPDPGSYLNHAGFGLGQLEAAAKQKTGDRLDVSSPQPSPRHKSICLVWSLRNVHTLILNRTQHFFRGACLRQFLSTFAKNVTISLKPSFTATRKQSARNARARDCSQSCPCFRSRPRAPPPRPWLPALADLAAIPMAPARAPGRTDLEKLRGPHLSDSRLQLRPMSRHVFR